MDNSRGWLHSLKNEDPNRAEKVYQKMREIREESRHAYLLEKKLRAPQGTISVGCADFDEFIEGYGKERLLHHLAQGDTPKEASEKAKNDVQEAIRKHNRKRADASWARWEQVGDRHVENATDKIVLASTKA